jgi:hypothetical protein
MYEWIFVYATVQYLYALMVGLIAGLGQQMGYWTPRRRRAAAKAEAVPATEPA